MSKKDTHAPLYDARDHIYDHNEVREFYLSHANGKGFAKNLGDDVVFDAFDPCTLGRLRWNSVVDMARWDWNEQLLRQAAGEEGYRLSLLESENPINPVQVSTHQVVVDRWAQIPDTFWTNPSGQVRANCGLFAVHKTEEKLRLIFDARPANQFFSAIPAGTLNFYKLDELMSSLDQYLWQRNVFFLSGDLRHFYYQLPLAECYGRYMGVKTPNGLKIPRLMAMGFAPAVAWAQATTLTVLLHAEDGDPLLGVREQDLKEGMPGIVKLYSGLVDTRLGSSPPNELGREIGFLVVLIDGFMLITTSKNLRDRWAKRIHRNLQTANLELKLPKDLPERWKGKEVSAMNFWERQHAFGLARSEKEVTFGGIEIVAKQGWRPASDLSPFPSENPLVRRDWGSILGELMWAMRVGRTRLLEEEDLMQLYSKVSARQGESWDDLLTLEAAQVAVLKRAHKAYQAKTWTTRQRLRLPRVWLFVLSDAFTRGEGWVVLRKEGNVLFPCLESSLTCPEETQIFREASAAVDGALHAYEYARETGLVADEEVVGVVIGVDAEGVRFPLEKGYSASPRLRGLLRTLYADDRWNKLLLKPVRVKGILNLADYQSRGVFTYLRPEWQEGFSETMEKDVKDRKHFSEHILMSA